MPGRCAEVEQIVREWLVEKQAARLEGIAGRLSSYDGVLAIGTERDEWWAGSDGFRSAHTSGGPFVATVDSVEAHSEGPVAWAAAQAVIETGEPGGLPVRLTLVLVRDEDGWRIVQSHASVPDAA
jgi:ketosteroid isomerase-like protein